MGIRFSCSNGHRLNVKAELAGRKGRCPKCGVAVHIPLVSETEAVETQSSTDALVIDTSSTKTSLASSKKRTDVDSGILEGLKILEKTEDRPPGHSSGTQFKPSVSLLSDPDAVWYIQVKDGPQYGPVTGPVLENWIREQRVAPTMLVWKDGWSDWLEAANAFPNLAEFFQSAEQISVPPTLDGSAPKDAAHAVSLSPQFQMKLEKKKKRARNFVLLVSFFISIIILIVLLFILLSR